MIDLAAPPPNPACQASKPRCPPEGLYFWICALWGVIIRRPSQRFQTQARTNVVDNDSEAPPNRPRRWHRQGPPGLHRLLRRLGYRPYLRDPRRSREPALVLVDDRQWP